MALSAFHFDILQGVAQYFSGGYFPRNASPFFLLPPREEDQKKPINYKQYLNRLAIHLRGTADMIFFYFITLDNHEIQRHFVGEKDKYPQFTEKENEANSIPNPRILLDYLKLDPEKINNALKELFGFDFELAATKVEQLVKTLKETERGKMTPIQAGIIKKGPQVLEYAQSIHEVIHQFLIDAVPDVASHYPTIAEIITETTQQVVTDLKDRIKLATGVDTGPTK